MKKAPWHWSEQKIVEFLTIANAKRGQRGRPSPVAARVLARLLGEV